MGATAADLYQPSRIAARPGEGVWGFNTHICVRTDLYLYVSFYVYVRAVPIFREKVGTIASKCIQLKDGPQVALVRSTLGFLVYAQVQWEPRSVPIPSGGTWCYNHDERYGSTILVIMLRPVQ